MSTRIAALLVWLLPDVKSVSPRGCIAALARPLAARPSAGCGHV